jgi:hypothetical protein
MLLRRHAEACPDALGRQRRVGHRVDEGDVFVDELRHVLVARRHDHCATGITRLAGEGADHVIGLDAGLAQQRQAHRANNVVDGLHLLAEIVGHWGTVGLVLRVDVVTEGLALRIEDHHHRGCPDNP